MSMESFNNLLYEIAENGKNLNQQQLDILLIITKAFKLENEYLKSDEVLKSEN